MNLFRTSSILSKMAEMPKQKYLEFLKNDIGMNEILQVV